MLSVLIRAALPLGLRAVTAPLIALLLASGALAAPGAADAQTVDSLAPTSLVRGTRVQVLLRGDDLDLLDRATLEAVGVVVRTLTVDSPGQARVEIEVGDRAPLGPLALAVFNRDDEAVTLPAGVAVVAGPPSVLTATPDAGQRGNRLQLSLTGRNLDVVEAIELGQGVEVETFNAASPTQALLQVRITQEAFSGPRTLRLEAPSGVGERAATLTVAGGPVTLGRLVPATGVRGDTFTVSIQGENLDLASELTLGSRITVRDWTVETPARATARVEVRDDATTGPRAATLIPVSGDPFTLPAAFRVEAGPAALLRVIPDEVRAGSTVELQLQGRNLDGLSAVEGGAGLAFRVLSAGVGTSAVVEVTATPDADPGLRNLQVTGTHGTATLADALRITERTIPPLQVIWPDRVEVGDTQVGALRTTEPFRIENLGEQDEPVRLGAPVGDRDLFSWSLLEGALTEAPDGGLTFTLAPGESVRLAMTFEPRFTGTNGVAFPITLRGQVRGQIGVTATGLPTRLLVNRPLPVDGDTIRAGAPAPLPRLSTRLGAGLPARSVEILGVTPFVARNGVPQANAASLLTTTLTSTVAGEGTFWGSTEVDWTLTADQAGRWEGWLEFETSADTAPRFRVPFVVEVVTPDPGRDPDAGPAADAGGEDAGSTADAGALPDAGQPASDAGTPGADSGGLPPAPDSGPADAGGERPDTDPAPAPGGSGGCHAAAPGAAGTTGGGLVVLMLLAGLQGRRRRGTPSTEGARKR
jgi:hypothetical protein